jgi:hypothetical protein
MQERRKSGVQGCFPPTHPLIHSLSAPFSPDGLQAEHCQPSIKDSPTTERPRLILSCLSSHRIASSQALTHQLYFLSPGLTISVKARRQ